MGYNIRQLSTKKSDVKLFVESEWHFYKNDPNWVPPLKATRQSLLDVNENPFFKHAKISLWLVYNNNEVVGRIAAIINENHNKTHKDKVGFIGFFDCINNQDVANLLFDNAAQWLKVQGMDTIRGPENISMNDEIGLLVDGFDEPAVFMMPYNHKYYINLFEGYGFEKAKDLYAYDLRPENFATDKLRRLQEIVRKRSNATVREVALNNKKALAEDVKHLKEIYNSAWVPNWGFVKWTDEEFDHLVKDLKMIADKRFALVIEANNKVAGFAIALPDINQVLINNKKGGLIGGMYNLLFRKKSITRFRIIVLGIKPEYQNAGLDSVLYYELGTRAMKYGLKAGEASWILEDNLMMNRALKTIINGVLYKTYRLYDKKI